MTKAFVRRFGQRHGRKIVVNAQGRIDGKYTRLPPDLHAFRYDETRQTRERLDEPLHLSKAAFRAKPERARCLDLGEFRLKRLDLRYVQPALRGETGYGVQRIGGSPVFGVQTARRHAFAQIGQLRLDTAQLACFLLRGGERRVACIEIDQTGRAPALHADDADDRREKHRAAERPSKRPFMEGRD